MHWRFIVVDFETHDPGLKQGISWPQGKCTPLGVALLSSDARYQVYETNFEKAKQIISGYNTIVCHNAQYDCGILHMLGYDLKPHLIIDTKILAKLYDNTLYNTSLDALADKFFQEHKHTDKLIELAHELKERKLIKFSKVQNPLNALYANMHIAQDYDYRTIEKYAIKDVELTEKLYKMFLDKLDLSEETAKFYSDLIKSLIKSRANGVPVDSSKMEHADRFLRKKMIVHKRTAHKIAKQGFNLNPSIVFYKVLDKLGIKYPRSETTGNPSVTKAFMEAHSHPLFKEIIEYKKYEKARRDFIAKMRTLQIDGVINPSFNIFGAATGRFTCTAPNIQQIPARDKETLAICRGIFRAPTGKTWVSIDYSAQEPRLQVHYAYKTKCPGSDILRQQYLEDPNLDLHSAVSKICGIDRKEAKTINLGLSYGMGNNKLADSLGMSVNSAVKLKDLYHKRMPYLYYLMKKCENSAKRKGGLTTLGGRFVHVDAGYEYKSLNYLIQGSAADQTMAAMVECYRQGIDILFSVHDELNFLVDDGDIETIDKVKNIMETCYKLEVPVVAEVKTGKSWADCK